MAVGAAIRHPFLMFANQYNNFFKKICQRTIKLNATSADINIRDVSGFYIYPLYAVTKSNIIFLLKKQILNFIGGLILCFQIKCE